jgi:hypothetical protein
MKKQLILAAALSIAAVASSFGQGTIGFNNGTSSKISTNSIENSVASGLTQGASQYYYALFYSASATTVSGSAAAVAGTGKYAFGDSSWTFSGAYGTNAAAPGRFASASADANGNTAVTGVIGGSAAQFVVIGWSANIGTTLSALEAWYANPTLTGWIGESIVSGTLTTGAGVGFPPGLFGASPGDITGFGLGEIQASAVPEPTTVALIGLGGLGLAMIRRRK